MRNRLKEIIAFDGLNYKKETIKIFLISLSFIFASVLLYFYFKKLIYSLFAFMGMGIIDFVLINSYSTKKANILKSREEEFVVLISYFEIFISNNNNVYQAFSSLLEYCSPWMKDQVSKMLEEIDLDKTVQPFINFAHQFSSPIVMNVMLSIFQMVDQGETNEQIVQFTILFEQISKAHQKDLIEQKENSLSTFGIFPLIGAAMITLILTFSILSILGDLINVL